MKTTGVSSIPKFGLLGFLGHPIMYVFFFSNRKLMPPLKNVQELQEVMLFVMEYIDQDDKNFFRFSKTTFPS